MIEDEISNYINARYIGSTEAAWRVFEMSHHCCTTCGTFREWSARLLQHTHTAAQVAAGEAPRTTLASFLSFSVKDPFA